VGLALEAKRYQSAAWHGAVPYSVHPPPGGANDFFSLYSLHAQRLPREPGKRDRETEERHLLPTALPQLLLTPNSCDTLYSPSR